MELSNNQSARYGSIYFNGKNLQRTLLWAITSDFVTIYKKQLCMQI